MMGITGHHYLSGTIGTVVLVAWAVGLAVAGLTVIKGRDVQ
jgi:hypothetical protein